MVQMGITIEWIKLEKGGKNRDFLRLNDDIMGVWQYAQTAGDRSVQWFLHESRLTG